jgi:hypothetical protein
MYYSIRAFNGKYDCILHNGETDLIEYCDSLEEAKRLIEDTAKSWNKTNFKWSEKPRNIKGALIYTYK